MKKALIYLLVFLAIQLIAGAFVQGIWTLASGSAEQTAGMLITTTAVCSLLTIIIFLWQRYALVSPAWLRTRPWTVLAWSVVAAIGALIPSAFFQEMMPELPNFAEAELERIMSSPWGYISVGLMAPLSEEIVLRGGVLRMLLGWTSRPYAIAETENRRMSPWAAIALSAVLFALIHFNPVQMPHAFLIGLLLGWMYWRTGSILPGVAYHWANNSAAFVANAFYPDPDVKLIEVFKGSQTNVYLAVAFSLLVFLPAVYQLYTWMKRADEQ